MGEMGPAGACFALVFTGRFWKGLYQNSPMKMMGLFSTLFKRYSNYVIYTHMLFCLYLLQPYIAGQCSALLKWKPPNLNTVDFKLAVIDVDRPGCVCITLFWNNLSLSSCNCRMLKEKIGQLWVGGYHMPFSQIDLKVRIFSLTKCCVITLFQRNKEARSYNGRIVECSWTPQGWKFLRLRQDKSFPNSYTTAASEWNHHGSSDMSTTYTRCVCKY